MTTAREEIVERIEREGPIAFDAFVELALYGGGGFFTRARGAGRAGRDFVTSPEVGALFGALVARALDGWWRAAGTPDPFLVIEAGAGRGRLASDVLAATPECSTALRYVLVERSAWLRAAQRDLLTVEPFEDALGPVVRDEDEASVPVTRMGPIVTALDDLPAVPLDGVVFANELLDNLPFRIVERRAGAWSEVRVALDGSELVESVVPATAELAAEADLVTAGVAPPDGARIPVPTALLVWLRACASALRAGRLVVVDYTATCAELVERGQDGWLRTYRNHDRGLPPLVAAGEQDITFDVPREYLVHAAARVGFELERELTQAEWLGELGVDGLVADARSEWDVRASIGDLEALRHRSRVTEGAALVDPNGLGAHRVLVFRR
jgi:NADH dehydrogenase [ubiquinone] 1 alpha subcomplex assembly factor 7